MLVSSQTVVVAALLTSSVLAPAAAPIEAAAFHANGISGSATPDRTGQRVALQRALDSVVGAGVPGAIIEVRDGRAEWRATSGVARLSDGRRVRAGDRFRAGSVTKSFVATVVLQLVAERRIGLDDPIEQHLPGLVPPGRHGEHVTVRQLLNHTSGLPDYLADVLLQRPDAIRALRSARYTPRELVAMAVAKGWKFDPGTQGAWAYSNTNYVVLGLLVERVAGHSLGQEIARRIIRPLHLTDTSFPSSAQLPGPHMDGYEWLDGPAADPADLTEYSPAILWSAGTLISTVHDLNSFFRELAEGKLLPAHLLREMRTMRAMGSDRPGRSYGLGLEGNVNYCHWQGPVWGHSGSVAGYNTFSFTTADGRRQVTLALSRDFTKTPEADAAARRILTTTLCGPGHGNDPGEVRAFRGSTDFRYGPVRMPLQSACFRRPTSALRTRTRAPAVSITPAPYTPRTHDDANTLEPRRRPSGSFRDNPQVRSNSPSRASRTKARHSAGVKINAGSSGLRRLRIAM